MPRDGNIDSAPLGRRTFTRTVSGMALAGVVTLPSTTGFAGPDRRHLAIEAEIAGLLARPVLTRSQRDRLEQLDDAAAFLPAYGFAGAAMKLRRLLCPVEGLASAGMLRENGADLAALRDVLRLVERANRAPAHGLGRAS